MKIGMVFPGQGSQFVGMAKDFYDKERLIQEYFEEASNCLDQNFIKLCFASSEQELMGTVNAQTSIFLVSASIYRLLNEKYGITPDFVAGHSLGEYGALFAAGGINFPDALYLLNKRASFMEESTFDHVSGMLAVINFSENRLKEIVNKHNVSDSNEAVAEIVNFNSANQFVVSGTLSELAKIKEEITAEHGKAIQLKVSGAFHSRLMNAAQEKFSTYMEKVDFHDLSIPIINNIEAKKIEKAEDIRESLVKQVSSPVLWWQSMQYFKDCDIIVEIGPGVKFSKMLKREWPQKQILSINAPKDIDTLLEVIESLKPKDEIVVKEENEKKEETNLKSENIDSANLDLTNPDSVNQDSTKNESSKEC